MKKKVERLTPTERIHRRRLKRKNGPSALKRKAARSHLQPAPIPEPTTEPVTA